MTQQKLVSLPFYDALTPAVSSIDEQRKIKASLHETLLAYEVRGPSQDYVSKIASVRISDVLVTALSSTPSYVSREITQSRDLIIPMVGALIIGSGKTFLRVDPKNQCFLEGLGHQTLETSFGSYLRIKFNFHKFHPGNYFDLNAGVEGFGKVLLIDKISAIEIKYLLSVVNLHFSDPDFLIKLSIDHIALTILSRLLGCQADESDTHHQNVRTEIRKLCEYLREYIDQPISLYLMESISGLSSRTIQNAFRTHYYCRPMEWVRNERLEKARTILLASPQRSITELSYHLGFCSPSYMDKFYRMRFGELPSRTRNKSRPDKNKSELNSS